MEWIKELVNDIKEAEPPPTTITVAGLMEETGKTRWAISMLLNEKVKSGELVRCRKGNKHIYWKP